MGYVQLFSLCYVQLLDCVMCSFLVVFCAVFSVCYVELFSMRYVQFLACVVCCF